LPPTLHFEKSVCVYVWAMFLHPTFLKAYSHFPVHFSSTEKRYIHKAIREYGQLSVGRSDKQYTFINEPWADIRGVGFKTKSTPDYI
jgi:hypothetical protein